MELFNNRKLKFKAWNTETRLLMRLNSIDCIRGELYKKNHILLQFTGLHDKQGEEIYDMDVLLKDNRRYLIRWDNEQGGWTIISLEDRIRQAEIKEICEVAFRLRSYFEPGADD